MQRETILPSCMASRGTSIMSRMPKTMTSLLSSMPSTSSPKSQPRPPFISTST